MSKRAAKGLEALMRGEPVPEPTSRYAEFLQSEVQRVNDLLEYMLEMCEEAKVHHDIIYDVTGARLNVGCTIICMRDVVEALKGAETT